MARYFKSLNKPNGRRTTYPTYGVMSDSTVPTGNRQEPEHPYGVTELKYHEGGEIANFYSDGSSGTRSPTELFDHLPSTLTVSTMFADHRLRPHMMTVMALAMRDHPGAQLVAGSHLTDYSSDLSRNAHKKGLVVPHADNPDMQTEYESEYGERRPPAAFKGRFTQTAPHEYIKGSLMGDYAVEVPHSEVMAGKQFLKQMLRPGTTRKQTPRAESEQMQLPGMESK